MTRYHYTAIGPNGQKKQGTLDAAGRSAAARQLAAAGERVLTLRNAGKRNWFKPETSMELSQDEAGRFALELAGLLAAGAPLVQSLNILAEGDGARARLANDLARTIDHGRQLSDGLATHGGGAGLLVPFAEAGQAGAGLDAMLERGGTFLRSRATALQKIQNALAYPLFILGLAVIAMTVITLFVAPALAPSFEGTRDGALILFLAAIGEAVADHYRLVLVGLALFVLASFATLRAKPVQKQIGRLLLRVPLIGPLKRDLDAGQALSVLAALLQTGRSLESALYLSGDSSGSSTKDAFERIALRLRDGVPLARAFSSEPHLPLEVKRLAALGERSSALPKAMQQASDLCLERAMRRLEQISSSLGPALVILLGVSVSLLMLNVLGSLASIGGESL